ncbi:hypothetical protein BDV18DRAFT_160452 [Aspergillus unguis]
MPHPETMKAWLYASTSPSVTHNLEFTPTARTPQPPSHPSQLLIKVHCTSLNPADYKVPQQSTILGKPLICNLPASPGLDFSGEVVAVHPNHNGEFKPDDRVFGCLARPRQFGTTAEYVLAETNDTVHLPAGVSFDDGACLGVAARTAYQSLKGYITPDASRGQQQKVLINGGSGGCGVFAIQIAKSLGAHVVTTCSGRNAELVRGLGADEVLDYTAVNVTDALKERGQVFDHVVDHIGLPGDLYAEAHHFLKEGGVWVQVGAAGIMTAVWRLLTPRWLGGGRRWFVALMMKNSKEDLGVVGDLVNEGKLRVIKEPVYGFAQVKEAYEKLGSGRARGKIVVRVVE